MASSDKQPSQANVRVFISHERWEAFFTREYTVLLNVAIGMLGKARIADAKDAVQNAFVSLARSRDRSILLNDRTFEEAVRGYLIRVVRNWVLNLYRARVTRRETEELCDSIPAGLDSYSFNPYPFHYRK